MCHLYRLRINTHVLTSYHALHYRLLYCATVYANIASLSAISWQLLRFNSLKKHFPQIFGFKWFENGLRKGSLIWNFFPDFGWKPRFSLISLTGKSLQNFPWIPWFPWSVGTLQFSDVWFNLSSCGLNLISRKLSKVTEVKFFTS